MKKASKNEHMALGMSLGMCVGVAMGTSLGSLFDNMGIGISLGLCFGMAIGCVLGALKDKEVNKQVEEKGYTVKEIVQKEDSAEYFITIVDKLGAESVVNIPKGQMEAEKFAIGDVVFLDEDGLIEQAFEKEEN